MSERHQPNLAFPAGTVTDQRVQSFAFITHVEDLNRMNYTQTKYVLIPLKIELCDLGI